jgi:hypothetical protein
MSMSEFYESFYHYNEQNVTNTITIISMSHSDILGK